MAVNNSPFLTRLTRAISFNVLLTRLLGSNKTNLRVTPLQTLVSRSFIFYFNKKNYQISKAITQQAIRFLFDQTINPVDVLRLGVSTIRLFYNQIFNLLYNYIFLLYASNSLFTLGGNHMGLGVPFLLSLLGIFLNIFYHFPCQMYLYYLYSIQCARLYYTVNE